MDENIENSEETVENNEVIENNEEVIENISIEEQYKDLGLRPEEIAILKKQEAKENGEEIEEVEEVEEVDKIAGKFETIDELIKSGDLLKEKYSIDDGIDFDDLTDSGKEKYYKKLESLIGNENNEKEEVIEVKENIEDNDFFKDSDMDEKDKNNFNSYANEYIKNNGQITEETRNDIKSKYNIPDVIIDEYLSNLDFKVKSEIQKENSNKQNDILNNVYKNIAPQEEISKSLNWADSNLTEFQKELYNKELASNDENRVFKAAKEINNLYKSSEVKVEKKVKKIVGKTIKSSSSNKYSSKQEYFNDIKNIEYQRNPEFRRQVEKKMINSNIY